MRWQQGDISVQLDGDRSEQELHERVAKLLTWMVILPAKWTCVSLGALKLTKAQTAKLSRMGVQPSWPDFIVVHRGIYGLELKRPGGRLSTTRTYQTASGRLREVPGQDVVFEELMMAGMQIRIAMHEDDVMGALRAWGIPLRAGDY